MHFTFDSQIRLGEELAVATTKEIKDEPMLFSASFRFAIENGGPLTRQFIARLNEEFIEAEDLIIDSRVHLLMPNWFPAIPGFHHDDSPRTRSDGQPNYHNPSYLAKHAMALQGGDCCPTQFSLGTAEFEDVPLGKKYYKEWHPVVEKYLRDGVLTPWDALDHRIIYFDWQTWHQGTAAIKSGWRWFIRATINTGRKPTNEIRKQTQIYLATPMEGW